MSRTIVVIASLAATFYLALCVAVFMMQRSLIYFPQPRAAGQAATITLRVDDVDVLVTVRARPGPKAIIYFGGNAEDVSYNLPGLAQAFPDHAIYLMHYRGYGGSAGTPSEAALFADALALFDRVHAQHARVAVVGRSLGSGVAVHLASLRPVERLVLVTPYDSIEELAVSAFPWLPVRWLLQDRYQSWKYAPQVKAPTLLIMAGRDGVIPRASTQRLLGRFRAGVAVLKVLEAADHNTISASREYMELLGAAIGHAE